MAMETLSSKSLSVISEAPTCAETTLTHQPKPSLHHDFMTNRGSATSCKHQCSLATSSCSESVGWFGAHSEVSDFSKVNNSDGSSSMEERVLLPAGLHLPGQSLDYNGSSASYTPAANVIIYASSARSESLIHNITTPHLDLVPSTGAGQFQTDNSTREESPNSYTTNLINRYTSTVPNVTSPGISIPSCDNFLSGSCPTFNPYGFGNDEASTAWKKTFSHTSEIDQAFQDKIPGIDYGGPGQPQYLTDNQHFYNEGGDNSYVFQEFSNAYLSRDNELPFNSQTHQSLAAGADYEQRDTNTNPPYTFSSNILELRKPYRSFSSELNSPNLTLSEETDLDFEFPLQLELGAVDFDSFMSNVPNGNSTNNSKVSVKKANINFNAVANFHTDFGSIDSYNKKYKHDCLSRIERTDSKINLSASESSMSKRISGLEEQQCLNIDEGIPVSQRMSQLSVNTVSQSGMSFLTGERLQHHWLGCHSASETAHKTATYDLAQADLATHLDLTSHHAVTTHHDSTSHHAVTTHRDSTSSAFGSQEYPESAGDNKPTNHELRTHNLRTGFDVTSHNIGLDHDEATHYSLSSSVFSLQEYPHISSGNSLNVGNFLYVPNETGSLEESDVKRCINGRAVTPGYATTDPQLSGICDTRRDCLPTDSHSALRRNECGGSFKWQDDPAPYGHRSWLNRRPSPGCGGTSYVPDEEGYCCKQIQGQGKQKFVDLATDLVFAGFGDPNFRDSPSAPHSDISSTTKATHDCIDEHTDRDGYHDSTVEGTVLGKLSQQDFRECSSNETGQRALAAVIQQTSLGAECFDSNLVKSAIDHIIMNRPRTISKPMGTETVIGSYRRPKSTQTMSGHVSQVLTQRPEDNQSDRDGRRKRRKVCKPASEDVTTTTRTPSPSAPSSSSSPSISLTSRESFPAASLAADVTLLSPSTNENNSSSNVTSSSKPDKRRPSVLPPCRVCCSKASGLHYGVVTCEACNGFFRRSLKRGAIYMCSKEKKCDVNGKKRGECSHCRYKKCLTVGMSKSAVKTGRYSDKTRLAYAIETEAQNKTNLLLNEFPEVKGVTSQILNIHEMDVGGSSLFEFDLLEKQFKHLRQSSPHLSSAENTAKVMPLYECNLPEMPTTTFPEYLSKLGLSNMRSIILEQWLGQYLSFAKSVPGFNILTLNDQTNLVRAAWLEVWLLEAYKEFGSDMKGTATSPGIPQEIETIFGKSCLDLCYRLSARLEKLNISADELTLVQMLCLTDPLRYRLDTPEQVSSLQWLMSECLLRELEQNHPDEPHAFSEIHSLLTDLKAACHDSLLPSNDYQLQYSPTQETPLLQEMLTSSAPQ